LDPEALENLREIYNYISKDSKIYAKRTVLSLRYKTKILINFPESGKINSDYHLDYVREIIEGQYRIIYMIIDLNRIDILTIHHSARDFSQRSLI
jgi:toxin ParE1/3/4